MTGRGITLAAVHGTPVTPIAHLVAAGEYADYRIICVCADEGDAQRRAGDYNRQHHPGEHDAARVEPIEFVPARTTRSG